MTRLTRILFCSICISSVSGATEQIVHADWPDPTETSRPWTRWWWPGSALTEEGVTRQLEALRDAGLGGVEITPIYGARGWEEQYVDFLSPRWLELLSHTVAEADRLGLRVDMATGTGWPFGGPQVRPENAAQRIALAEGAVVVEGTGQKVKRAAPGGEGLVLDPFSSEAIKDYLEGFGAALADLPAGGIRAQFHDSFEYYGANWTDDFPDRFEQMHGYSVEDYMKALLGEAGESMDKETLARLKHDYRVTLDVLHQEYLQAWADWADDHGWLTRNQSHGAPANLLDLYAIADIPETEIFGSTPFPIPGLRREADAIRHGLDLPDPLVTRMASSAAHVGGKRLASSETATWLRDHWKVTLAAVKPEIDRIFLDGINHVFYHGTVYSPPDATWPGWLFYASTQFNPNNPWWEDSAALNRYVDRVQRVLQGGSHGNDVLLYWPASEIWQDAGGDLAKQLTVHDASFVHDRPYGRLAQQLKDNGYAFDYVSDRQIAGLESEQGWLAAPGGRYAALVVPPTEVMPVDTLRALLELARNGATVIFAERPKDVPGWGRLAQRRAEFRSLLQALPQPSPESGERLAPNSLGQGQAQLGDPLAALLRTEAVREPLFEQGLECIRRRSDRGTDYFIANLNAEAFDGWVTLGVAPEQALLLDPLSGKAGTAALRRGEDQAVEARLQLAPGESMVVRASSAASADAAPWPYLEKAGPALALDGGWTLVFESGGPEVPAPAEMTRLHSWTELGPEAERFSGTVRYRTQFDMERSEPEIEWLLDLGDLRDSARVSVNGTFVGTVWSLPFRIRIGDYLRDGLNTLELEVTNTAANRVRDLDRRGVDWKIMHEINFVDINYRPFDASGWDVQPAGLLGPVQLIPMKVVER